jgi:flagellar basal body-associated protein FliL
MTTLVILTIVDIVLLVAGLAFYLFWVGTLLARIAGNLEECAEIVRTIVGHAELIGPGVEHINQTGGVVAGALPLLYGMAEEIVANVTPRPEQPAVPEPARPASGTRRSRLHDAVGFTPHR